MKKLDGSEVVEVNKLMLILANAIGPVCDVICALSLLHCWLVALRVAENSIGPRHKFLQRYKSDF